MDYEKEGIEGWHKKEMRQDRDGINLDIVSMLTLPETIAQTLLLLPGVLLHLGNNIGFVRLSLGVSACSQCLHIHASYSIPILSLFLFMPSLYALLFVIHRIIYLLVSTHFYTWLSWKRLNTHAHPSFTSMFAILSKL